MSKPEAGGKTQSGSAPLRPLRSLPSRDEVSSCKAPLKLGTSQRVCKLLLERHGDRIIQLLLSNEVGQKLLKTLLAVSFGAADHGGGNLLMRLLDRDPESVVPFLFKKSDKPSVAKGLGACLVRGVSGVEVDELKPVTAALAEAVMEQLQTSPTAAPDCMDALGQTTPAAAAAAPVEAAGDSGISKRVDDEGAAEVPKRRSSRVQELIEQQQRRCREQQQQQRFKHRTGTSGLLEGTAAQESGISRCKSRCGCFESLMKEALIFAASEASSAELEDLCDQLVSFAPAVLTKVIKIEVARNSSEKLGTLPNAAPAEEPQSKQEQGPASP